MAYLAHPDLYEPPSVEELEFYEVHQIARWAGVPVWELLKQPVSTLEGYRHAREVEIAVQTELNRSAGKGW